MSLLESLVSSEDLAYGFFHRSEGEMPKFQLSIKVEVTIPYTVRNKRRDFWPVDVRLEE